ncbi:MAG: tRNA dihydrouridine synthase DusB [Halieaceae bacterium]|jgi:tRNA-dihydrouridine synthase B|nr:tRNA dihydrouridine synthase DusB [Halieaceae bacterium]
MLAIGPYKLDNPVALAPMAGVTDLPFRQLCRRLGAGLVVSEMITSDTRLWNSRKSRQRLPHVGESEPRSVQIAGADPAMMAEAARRNVELGAQIIDINMGCPAKKVCKRAAGSALLQDEALVRSILSAVVDAVDVPVTLKIRTGPSPQQRNGVSIARIAEDAGIALLAVHGRTRACRFKGEAEFETLADICKAVAIPVLANGDIQTPERARQVMQDTGAAGVMIGRAAQGRPWLCGDIAHYLATGTHRPQLSEAAQAAIMREHLNALYAFYGEYMGLRIARKHVGWYLQQAPGGEWLRGRFNLLESAEQQLALLDDYFYKQNINEDLAA